MTQKQTLVYGIKNCDSVKKARNWLEQHQVEYQFHDFRTDGLDRSRVEQWCHQLGWETLLNKRGTTWRQLDEHTKSDLDRTAAVALMTAHPTLIKRPVIETDGHTASGFNASVYAKLFG